ncbi:MAG: CPBP family intramembrane metalloprotease [Gammaproteobacteria bacterium]|nr:CPBP family intramembrane metalloprotease [Gammaproteobacteria bacterium]
MNQTAEIQPLWRRLWNRPGVRGMSVMLFRLIVFIALTVGLSYAMRTLVPLPRMTSEQSLAATGWELWLRAIRALVPTVLAYWLLVRFVERRKVTELAPQKFLTHSAVGWIVGMGIMLVATGAMAAAGAYRIDGVNEDAYLLGPLVVLGLMPGITEEIVARGILFRVVEEGVGSWAALVFSALLFGFGHAANPNATIWSSVAIAIEAGLLLGMAYAWTRSLWFCMGLHAAWNFTQGPLLGISVSGIEVKGLLASHTSGHELISGGPFGAEASILTLVICVSLGLFFARKAIAEGKILRPSWRRPLPSATAASTVTEPV